MNKGMLKKLGAFVGGDELISIYTDTDDTDFFKLGYLIGLDKNNVMMNLIDTFGQEDGFYLCSTNDIFIFDIDKMYSEKIKKLFDLKGQKRQHMSNLDSSPVVNLLKNAFDNHLLIEVNEDTNYIGYINEFSEQFLVLELIDNYGNDMGMANIDMRNVNILECQNRYLKDMELLYGRK